MNHIRIPVISSVATKPHWLLTLICNLICAVAYSTSACQAEDKAIIVIHGGAGVESGLSKEQQQEFHKALSQALLKGYELWKQGLDSVSVVEACVRSLEDCPLFNAGKGAVFTHDGKNELDAAIMDGSNRKAGAVAAVTTIKNPITAAVAVMKRSPHVMLIGNGAERFAAQQGIETVDPKYFWTEKRWQDLQKKLKPETNKNSYINPSHKYGTVGAVALDKQGDLAAGTSTGGITNKLWGRVGDSPIIGAGTFADNYSCAVSCTGEGEWFIRYNVASDVAARMKYLHLSVAKAADAVINGVLGPGHGEGGLIALDKQGNFTMPFNCEGMYRGYVNADGQPHTFIYAK
ncbi:MAG: isoaspartyl peptidase/L-asparaginase [Candidatus Obscuribacterales bacterium]|nr:isoaspartyl peptidase/L-asparaginase [Candidatus Obscuribacterales bacterium]